MHKLGFYNLLGQLLKIVANVAPIPILISNLGLYQYGVWIWCNTIVNATQVLEGGISLSIVHFLPGYLDLDNDDAKRNKINSLITNLGFSILILSLIASVSVLVFHKNIIQLLDTSLDSNRDILCTIKLSALLIALRMLQNIGWGILQASSDYKTFNLINTSQFIITNVCIVGVSMNSSSLSLLMFCSIVVSLVTTILQLVVLRRKFFNKYAYKVTISSESFKEHLSYSIKTWGSTIGSAIFTQGDKLIVGKILGSQTLALYSTLTSITAYIGTLSSQVAHPILPSVSKGAIKRNKLISDFESTIFLNAFVAIFLSATILTLANPILETILSKSYDNSLLTPFKTLLVIYALYSLNAVGYYTLLGMKKPFTVMVMVLCSGILSIVLVTLGAYNYGLQGAALGNSGYIVTIVLVALSFNYLQHSLFNWLKIMDILLLWFTLVIIYNFTYIEPSGWKPLAAVIIQSVVLLALVYKNKYIKSFIPL